MTKQRYQYKSNISSWANTLNEKCIEVYEGNKEKGFWDLEIPDNCLDEIISAVNHLEHVNNNKNEFKEEILTILQKHKVKHAHNVPEKLALIHSEVSEALEGTRKDLQDDHLPHRTMLETELADSVIRILDLAGHLNLDLGGAIEEKLEYNRSRPHKHGKKF